MSEEQLLCVSPETHLLTDLGHRQIAPLAGQNVIIWNGFEWSSVLVVKTGTNQKLLSVETDSGPYLECTSYHKWYVFEGMDSPRSERRTHELRPGDRLCTFTTPIIEGHQSLDHAYVHGFYCGDGCLQTHGQMVYLYHDKRHLQKYFEGGSDWVIEPEQKRMYKHYTNLQAQFFVPNANYTVKSRLLWLSGYLDSDAECHRAHDVQRVHFQSTQFSFLRDIQLMLQTLGVQCRIKRSPNLDDTYQPRGWSLMLGHNEVQRLMTMGLLTHRLRLEVMPTVKKIVPQFVEVTGVYDNARYDDTYCVTEPYRNKAIFNGILTGQCAETTTSERTPVHLF